MSWFLKQKDRLGALNPDMSEKMVHKRILRKCGGDLEHSIRSRFIEPFSTEDYINAMEDITTRTKLVEVGINPQWTTRPVGNQFQNPINHMTKLLLNVISVEVHLIWLILVPKRQESMR
ncbi:hypothetical protein O181_116206 [Austropuccinia psidii MF-1]|uniref:Uncharacterized protein n=1 Tax=Austropuccinia psidii MF-1 TaxID=1389203 RepID=A0A9Q3KAB2_9BASI|nr:hypothetical protein [Austropuccinia psidii MF-1]